MGSSQLKLLLILVLVVCLLRSSRCAVTMVLVGRTGVGKSTLANKMAKKDNLFEEGHTLTSQTDIVKSTTITWPHDSCTEVKIVDTPGLADNRPEISNGEILSKVLDFVKNLEEGLHIVLFCLNAKTRIDSHDTQELEMLGMLLGSQLFDHVYIVVTQGNTLVKEQKEKTYRNFKNDLPRILMEHNIPMIPQEKILFADFDNFDDFLNPLTNGIQTANIYKPKIAEGIDTKDPESIERFLQTPEMKKAMEKYEEINRKQRDEIAAIEKRLADQKVEMDKRKEESQKEQIALKKNLETVNKALQERQFENEAIKKQYEDYKQNQQQQLNTVNQAIATLGQQNSFYESQLKAKHDQIERLNTKMDELRNQRQQPVIIRERGGGRGCNIF